MIKAFIRKQDKTAKLNFQMDYKSFWGSMQLFWLVDHGHNSDILG